MAFVVLLLNNQHFCKWNEFLVEIGIKIYYNITVER